MFRSDKPKRPKRPSEGSRQQSTLPDDIEDRIVSPRRHREDYDIGTSSVNVPRIPASHQRDISEELDNAARRLSEVSIQPTPTGYTRSIPKDNDIPYSDYDTADESDTEAMTQPFKFYGKPSQVDPFFEQISIQVALHAKYSDPLAKSALIASCLQGSAATWYVQTVKLAPKLKQKPDELEATIRQQFDVAPAVKLMQAETQVRRLRQRTSVRDYGAKFDTLANQLGLGDRAKKTMFLEGLKPQLKAALMANPALLDVGYANIKQVAEQVDDATYSTSSHGGNYKSQGGGFKGKCNKCGKFGHKAATCRSGGSSYSKD